MQNHFLFDMQRIVELLIGDEGVSVRVRRVANVVDDGVFVRVVEFDERCDELDGVEEAAGWVGVAADDKNLSRADYGESIQDLPEMIVGLHHARRDMGRDRVAGCHECRSFVEGRLDSFRRRASHGDVRRRCEFRDCTLEALHWNELDLGVFDHRSER